METASIARACAHARTQIKDMAAKEETMVELSQLVPELRSRLSAAETAADATGGDDVATAVGGLSVAEDGGR